MPRWVRLQKSRVSFVKSHISSGLILSQGLNLTCGPDFLLLNFVPQTSHITTWTGRSSHCCFLCSSYWLIKAKVLYTYLNYNLNWSIYFSYECLTRKMIITKITLFCYFKGVPATHENLLIVRMFTRHMYPHLSVSLQRSKCSICKPLYCKQTVQDNIFTLIYALIGISKWSNSTDAAFFFFFRHPNFILDPYIILFCTDE